MLTFTDRAVSILKSVAGDTGLRIGVATGGCSGLQYRMSLGADAEDGDEVLELSGIRVVVDRPSTMWLVGVTVDFVDADGGGGFVFNNPNAAGKCSCSGGCG